MSVHSDAMKAYCEFEARTGGVKPKKLLLGHQECEELLSYCNKFSGIKAAKISSGMGRLEFRGMAVYAVDDQSYVGVAP